MDWGSPSWHIHVTFMSNDIIDIPRGLVEEITTISRTEDLDQYKWYDELVQINDNWWKIKSSIAAPKISSIFQEEFRESFGPKDWIFPKSCHNIQNFGKKL